MIVFTAKKTATQDGHLLLEIYDKNGAEYLDGNIIQVTHKGTDGGVRKILAYIRYFGGRFEAVAPFADQRFIFGLNPEHLIVGHLSSTPELIAEQAQRSYAP